MSAKHLLISLRQPRSQGLSRAGEKETLVGAGHVSQTKKVDQGMGTSASTVCNFFFFLSNPNNTPPCFSAVCIFPSRRAVIRALISNLNKSNALRRGVDRSTDWRIW